MPKVTENCICGATMAYEGEAPRWAADEFRNAHAVCREAAAKNQVIQPAPIISTGTGRPLPLRGENIC